MRSGTGGVRARIRTTSIPLSGSFVNSSLNQFGYNVGAGVTRKMPSGVEIYVEFRLMHGSQQRHHHRFSSDYDRVRW